MYHFCTYFDRNYMAQGLTLYRSLDEHASPFTLWVLCFDDVTQDILSRLNLDNLRSISIRDLEDEDEALRLVKKQRSKVEYYFTCTPSWPLYLMDHHPEMNLITYLDADLMFFSNPAPIFEELEDQSILIVGHRFPDRLRHLEIHGIYNVGLLSFRNDPYGRECLRWWRERCLEWCFDRPENGRFADQKYLDDWPARFPRTVVLKHKGAGLAPWNWMNYMIQPGEDNVTVDGDPLIFFHYQGFKIITQHFFETGVLPYGPMPLALRRRLYTTYVQAIFDTERWVRDRLPNVDMVFPRLSSRNYRWWTFVMRILRGQIMVVPRRQPSHR